MRAFSAALVSECNSFSPQPTTVADFEALGIVRGPIDAGALNEVGAIVQCWRDAAAAQGDTLMEGFYAAAQPAGPLRLADWQALRDELLAAVAAALPLDALLLVLHGAMLAGGEDAEAGEDDCEGELLQRLRSVVGPRCVIGVEFDPHAHLSPRMTEHADILVAMREYPHVDFAERAREVYRLVRGTMQGLLRPVRAVVDCRMVGFYPTTRQPMRGLVDRLAEVEGWPGMLSASLVHGFPWGDTPDSGTRVLAIADGSTAVAESAAMDLAQHLYRSRHALLPQLLPIDAAFAAAAGDDLQQVLADAADNPGGGAPGNHSAMLVALLARPERSAFGPLCDAAAVQSCRRMRIGARLTLSIGAPALELEVEVKGFAEQLTQAFGTIGEPVGAAAWVRCGEVDLVLTAARVQALSPSLFTRLGVPLHEARWIGVKSSHHYHAEFSRLTPHCHAVDAGGALSMDVARLPYRRRSRRYFPALDDPAPELR